jgi:glycosyltransferase involved in cell wall biosynthesis
VKIAEYLAMSRPVVAYGLPESRLAAGDAALYAEDDDPESFADCIAQLLDDPAQRERMGAAGRRRVESELSWEHSEIALRAAYEAAAARARRPVRKKRVVQLVESLDGSDF